MPFTINKDTFVICRDTDANKHRGNLLRLDSFSTVFEINAPPERSFEIPVFQKDFSVVLNKKTIYKGEALIDVQQIKGSQLVIEAILNPEWLKETEEVSNKKSPVFPDARYPVHRKMKLPGKPVQLDFLDKLSGLGLPYQEEAEELVIEMVMEPIEEAFYMKIQEGSEIKDVSLENFNNSDTTSN